MQGSPPAARSVHATPGLGQVCSLPSPGRRTRRIGVAVALAHTALAAARLVIGFQATLPGPWANSADEWPTTGYNTVGPASWLHTWTRPSRHPLSPGNSPNWTH
ncbi:hypothetical protein GCM10027589_13870 [Actinocorallia lasiicapitis]